MKLEQFGGSAFAMWVHRDLSRPVAEARSKPRGVSVLLCSSSSLLSLLLLVFPLFCSHFLPLISMEVLAVERAKALWPPLDPLWSQVQIW